MPFDFKKQYKEFYRPAKKPELIDIPGMNFLAVRGEGNPNQPGGAYQKALNLLYGVAYTIKMSYKGDYKIPGFFAYVVPPLEGFWWQQGRQGVDDAHKENFHWLSLIRLPDFVRKEDFDWAVAQATVKKQLDFSPVEFFTYTEGLCVQCLHVGPYDEEPATIALLDEYTKGQGYVIDISEQRYHHEIYLKDPRKTIPEKLQTVLRQPVRLAGTSPGLAK